MFQGVVTRLIGKCIMEVGLPHKTFESLMGQPFAEDLITTTTKGTLTDAL